MADFRSYQAAPPTTKFILVEQLNASQWHATCNDGCSGVTNWPMAVATALWLAETTALGIVSVDLDGNQLVLLKPNGAE